VIEKKNGEKGQLRGSLTGTAGSLSINTGRRRETSSETRGKIGWKARERDKGKGLSLDG